MARWRSADHPRADDGKFTGGPGGSKKRKRAKLGKSAKGSKYQLGAAVKKVVRRVKGADKNASFVPAKKPKKKKRFNNIGRR